MRVGVLPTSYSSCFWWCVGELHWCPLLAKIDIIVDVCGRRHCAARAEPSGAEDGEEGRGYGGQSYPGAHPGGRQVS